VPRSDRSRPRGFAEVAAAGVVRRGSCLSTPSAPGCCRPGAARAEARLALEAGGVGGGDRGTGSRTTRSTPLPRPGGRDCLANATNVGGRGVVGLDPPETPEGRRSTLSQTSQRGAGSFAVGRRVEVSDPATGSRRARGAGRGQGVRSQFEARALVWLPLRTSGRGLGRAHEQAASSGNARPPLGRRKRPEGWRSFCPRVARPLRNYSEALCVGTPFPSWKAGG